MALDPLVLVARQIMSIDAAARLFCIVTVQLLFAATRVINRQLHGGRGGYIDSRPFGSTVTRFNTAF
jgi:hypothetical protein